MKRPVIILGMRRSGTSVARRLTELSPDVTVVFEPRDWWWYFTQGSAVERFLDKDIVHLLNTHINRHFNADGVRGVKFAVDPCLTSFYWKHLERVEPRPKYVFIQRNMEDTWHSYADVDKNSLQGVVPKWVFSYFWVELYKQFSEHHSRFPERTMFMHYERLIVNPVEESYRLFKFLDVSPPEVQTIEELMGEPTHIEGFKSEHFKYT